MPWKAGRHRVDAVACSPYINYLHSSRILFLVTFTEQHNTCTSHSCKDSYCGQAYRTGGRNIRGVWFGRWRYRRLGLGVTSGAGVGVADGSGVGVTSGAGVGVAGGSGVGVTSGSIMPGGAISSSISTSVSKL